MLKNVVHLPTKEMPLFPLRITKTNRASIEFVGTLTRGALLRFLALSGDQNNELHGTRGMVQGVVWTILLNQAISIWRPEKLAFTLNARIFRPCYVRCDRLEVTLCLTQRKTANGLRISCRIFAPVRSGNKPEKIFSASAVVIVR